MVLSDNSKGTDSEMSFSLYYRIEAIISVEIGLPSLRVESFDPQDNLQKIREYLDLLEEARDAVTMRTVAYEQQVAYLYNKKVRVRKFEVGDLVLQSIDLRVRPRIGANFFRIRKALF
ncbi:hypothetical protein Nepgr_016949 [Nepenthes gracilis]|uniref:Uncharacterized protein n=1 Tax=Nepenthes gracilis TaxID=150966 RepID=A0AAD3SNJ1_NEPGR|nr:hypothetical protein Nepgr_016949 [Nepenthes gracilis]